MSANYKENLLNTVCMPSHNFGSLGWGKIVMIFMELKWQYGCPPYASLEWSDEMQMIMHG